MQIQNLLIEQSTEAIFNYLTDGPDGNAGLRICLLGDVDPSEKEFLLEASSATDMFAEEENEAGEMQLKYIHYQALTAGGIETFDYPLGDLVIIDGAIVVTKNGAKLNFFNFENVTGNVGGWAIYNPATNKVVGLDFIKKIERYVNNSDINISILSLISLVQ